MAEVPDRIYVGPTCYRHYKRGKKDLFVPDYWIDAAAASSGTSSAVFAPHIWRYSVSAAHQNTVFFFNEATRQSAWVLPIVHPDGRAEALPDGEAMRAISAEQLSSGGTTGDEEDEIPIKNAAGPPDDTAAATDSILMESTTPKPEGNADDSHDAKSKNGVLGYRTTPLTESKVSAGADHASVVLPPAHFSSSAAVAGQQLHDDSSGEPQSGGRVQPHGQQPSTLQARLSAWRLKQLKMQDQQQSIQRSDAAPLQESAAVLATSSSPLRSSSTASPSPISAGQTVVFGAAEKKGSTATNDLHRGERAARAGGSRGAVVVQLQAAPPADRRDAKLEMEDRQTVEKSAARCSTEDNAMSAELDKARRLVLDEKLHLMEEEYAAVECRRRAFEMEIQEEAEVARLAAERRRVEQQRLQQEEELVQQREKLAEVLRLRREAEEKTLSLNQYVEKQHALAAAAAAAQEHSQTYATRIANGLLAATHIKGIRDADGGSLHERSAAVLHQWQQSPSLEMKRGTLLKQKDSSTPVAPFQISCRADAAATAPSTHDQTAASGAMGTSGHPRLEFQGGSAVERIVPERQRGVIAYRAPFRYDGELVYVPSKAYQRLKVAGLQQSSRPPRTQAHSRVVVPGNSSALLNMKRDGVGSLYADAEKKSFFTGSWAEDERNGSGILSLPTTAVEGVWVKDQLAGPAMIQTRRAKAVATFEPPATPKKSRDGTSSLPISSLSGAAVVELDTGATYVGQVKSGHAAAPHVVQLTSKDYIEWLGTRKAPNSTIGGSVGDCGVTSIPQPPLKHPAEPTNAEPGSGECRIHFHGGDTYIGHLHRYRMEGSGYYRFADGGHSYTGEFHDGFPHGLGLFLFGNGDVYKGAMRRGLFDGCGVYHSQQEGFVYDGEWHQGAMEGTGVLSFPNGDVWEGTFVQNRRGEGRYTRVV